MNIDKNDYPALGFNFKVTSTGVLQGASSDPDESFFQSVSGIKATAGDSLTVNSGVNNRQYKLPTATTYQDLKLTRGLLKKKSGIADWCISFLLDDTHKYNVERRTVNVMLLDRNHDSILMTWSFFNCYPKDLEIGAFNADKSELAIETLSLAYSHFSIDY